MDSLLSFSPDSLWYTWVLLPLLIFLARVGDVSLQTLRVIFVSRGLKYIAPVVGFVEVFIWILVIGQIMKNLDNFLCYIAYAAGFAAGTFIGMAIEEKLLLGVVALRVITRKRADELIGYLRKIDIGVTTINAQGAKGEVHILFAVIKRQNLQKVVDTILGYNPNAFYSIEDVRAVNEGVFPLKANGLNRLRFNPFRRQRKGK
jgi:uncharacterized protein YebE (UPF0316 family)